ncbi:hypothetical protein FRC06_004992 [Ceratobasidium sp. 370]|nr:hypothetical protein FRC06_004992 [Ceratobasidium sp. 370]
MAIPSTFKAAFTAFRKSFGRDKKHIPVLNRIHDSFSALGEDALPAAELVEHTTRLAQALSESIPLLHKSRVRQTLAFCGSAIAWLCEAKHKPAARSGDRENAAIWEETILNGLIQPILDICDSGVEDAGIFGETVYPAICKAMRSSCAAAFGGRFARSVRNPYLELRDLWADDSPSKLALVLSCTVSAPKNKSVLLEPDVFGIPTLSKLIIDAKDYHHLDILLELSFKMFSTRNGTNNRKSYAEALFNSEYAKSHLSQEVRAELVRIHEVTNGSNSEKHILDIIRTMSSARAERPQVFSTQHLSYCGTSYMQRAPGNVVVLDNSSVSIIICDQDDETDVLTAPFTSIEKIEIVAPDASRTLVKFMVSEAPLIFSIRKVVETPTSHPNGTPLCLCISIAQSDVLDFETALAARDLANKFTGNGVTAGCPSATCTKISRAVSDVGLPEPNKENPSQERVDEMMDKYVNIPSSPNPAPVVVERKQPAPNESTDGSFNHFVKMAPTPAPQARHRVTKKLTHAPEAHPPPSSTARPRRACAAQAAKVIRRQAVELLDELELSEPEVTPEQPRRTVMIRDPASGNDALPTPPDTRKAKPAGKVLIPGSPAITKTQLESPSSPISEILSPTAKIVSKRKHVEDDPIEPSVDVQERGGERAQKILPSSQYIAPRNTAATRAKAKYTTSAKRMRVSSPDTTDRIDTEEPSVPTRTNEGGELMRSGDENSDSGEDVAEARPPPKKNDPIARSAGTFKKPKAITKAAHATSRPGSNLRPPESDDSMQGTREPASKERKDPPTARAGCPITDEKKQGTALLSEHVAEIPTSSQQLSLKSNPVITREEPVENLVRDIEFIGVEKASVVDNAEVEVDNEAPSSQGKFLEPLCTAIQAINVYTIGDELLAALSRAAKRAIRGSFPGSKDGSASPIEELSTSIGGQNLIDERTITTKADMEPGAPKLLISAEKAQPKSLKQEKALPEKQGPSRTTLNVPQALKARQPEESMQAGEATSKDTSLDNTTHMAGRMNKEHARRLSNGLGDKTTRVTGPSRVSSDDYSMPRVQGMVMSGTLESFDQSANYNPNAAIGRIQGALAVETAPTARPPDETLSTRRPASGAPAILIDLADADSEEDEPLQSKAQPPVAKPVFRQAAQKAIISNSIPTRLRSQPEIALHAAAKIRPARSVFEHLIRSPQRGPKSALASPQKHTVSRAGRPSVSFVDTPSPVRRGSSDSSVTGRFKSEQRDAQAKMLAGASARTGSTIMQIVEVLDAIQTTIAENLSEKVQTVTNDARNARAELTRTVVAKLGAVQAQAEHHCNTLREFEGVFATQTHEFLDGCNHIDRGNAKINAQVQEVMAKNARAGQRIAKMAVDFELPEAVSMYLVSD